MRQEQGDQLSKEEIEAIEVSRKASDEELVEGGSEIKEGKLEVTDEQYEHLQSEMKAELEADPEVQSGVVGYIKSHIEMDLSFQPQIKREVAKALDTLLKLSKGAGKDFIVQPIILLGQLENDPRIKALTDRNFVILHESAKAAMNFTQLNDEQREEVEKYIQGMIEKEVSQTFEQYMAKQLGLEAIPSWDPGTMKTDEGKNMMAALAMFNTGNLEDFTLNVPRGQENYDTEFDSVVNAYYKDQGYNVRKSETGAFFAEKDDEKLMIHITNGGDQILVSVIDVKR